MMSELPVSEAERRRRVPGIEFAGEPGSRYARIAGTGIKVWLLMHAYCVSGENLQHLREAYPHLTEEQIQAGLAYGAEFPAEIEARIALNNAFDIEQFWRENAWSRPPWR